jgi:hypothetical protein
MFDDAQGCILETNCTSENSLTLVDEDRFGYEANSTTVRAKTCKCPENMVWNFSSSICEDAPLPCTEILSFKSEEYEQYRFTTTVDKTVCPQDGRADSCLADN